MVTISIGAASFRPGWTINAAPVSFWAAAAAFSTFVVKGNLGNGNGKLYDGKGQLCKGKGEGQLMQGDD